MLLSTLFRAGEASWSSNTDFSQLLGVNGFMFYVLMMVPAWGFQSAIPRNIHTNVNDNVLWINHQWCSKEDCSWTGLRRWSEGQLGLEYYCNMKSHSYTGDHH